MSDKVKMPTETEMFTRIMVPLVERLGLDRANRAFVVAKPLFDHARQIVELPDKQASEDALQVLRHLLNTVFAMREEHEAVSAQAETSEL